MTTRALFCLFFVGLGCTARPTSWPVTEDDEYAIYKAIIELDRLSGFGGMTVEPATSQRGVSQLADLPQLEGFDPVAFGAFLAAEAAPKKLDVKRLERIADDSSVPRRFTFSRIGFDARGMTAVVYGSGGTTGNLYSLVRTVDGRWAVTRIRMLWIS